MTWEIVGIGRRLRQPLLGEMAFFCGLNTTCISFLKSWQPSVVLNLAASWRGVSDAAVRESNLVFPSRVAELIAEKSTLWIQVDSYFNLYYDIFGVDKDAYSQTKRELLGLLARRGRGPRAVQVIAPHLVGPNEPRGRLFESLVRGFLAGSTVHCASGRQFVPYVHVSDGAFQIVAILEQYIAAEAPARIHLRPLDCKTTRHIANEVAECMGADARLARFGALADPSREFYLPVPTEKPAAWLPEPQLSIRDIINDVLPYTEERFQE